MPGGFPEARGSGILVPRAETGAQPLPSDTSRMGAAQAQTGRGEIVKSQGSVAKKKTTSFLHLTTADPGGGGRVRGHGWDGASGLCSHVVSSLASLHSRDQRQHLTEAELGSHAWQGGGIRNGRVCVLRREARARP